MYKIEQAVCDLCPNNIQEQMSHYIPSWPRFQAPANDPIWRKLKEICEPFKIECLVLEVEPEVCLCKKHLLEIIGKMKCLVA